MELDVLRALDFNLGKPLPLHFLRRNSKAAGVDAKQHNFAKYFMEMTLQVSLPTRNGLRVLPLSPAVLFCVRCLFLKFKEKKVGQ